ncbi:hypothetical protein [Photobacterium lipolyticum]|uniref:Uncharacterized protein n=1 Tax=Photobacterium lipolyticum TaxID=266810 RepID=A0A2T3MW37_9GAMM|nr:hypothetical protein [Photobacterium lipolyticum]PSW04193.1 hypothetical protein C9I89_14540 [Photobacterium lipolyticum]
MDKHQNNVVLDFLESELKYTGQAPYGFELFKGATGEVNEGRYCRVQKVNFNNGFNVELGDICINVSEDEATELLNHAMCNETKPLSELDEFYLSADTHGPINEDASKEWQWYPANGSDVGFHETDDGIDNELLVITTFKEEPCYLRKDAKVFSYNGQFFVGYPFQATEISKEQYGVLKSSNRATSATTEETAAFGQIESFSLSEAPAQI